MIEVCHGRMSSNTGGEGINQSAVVASNNECSFVVRFWIGSNVCAEVVKSSETNNEELRS